MFPNFLIKWIFCIAWGPTRLVYQGELFSRKTLENIKFFKKSLPGIVISVDIGVNLENAEDILDAGADRLIIGSAIWKDKNPIGALENFQSLV